MYSYVMLKKVVVAFSLCGVSIIFWLLSARLLERYPVRVDFLRRHPVRRAEETARPDSAPEDSGYSEEEEAQISDRLKQWGYL